MKKKLIAVLQLAFGIGLVALLLNGIDKNSLLVEFAIPPSTVEKGAIYAPVTAGPEKHGAARMGAQYIVLEEVQGGTNLPCLHMAKSADGIPESGTLKREAGAGPETLAWTGRTASRHGLNFILDTFRKALKNWPLLLTGASLFGICIFLCILRWNLLLKAQGLELPFRRVVSIFFIGQFFNSFMPGAVGGDLVKAFFVAKETHHQKTEAVTTVVIDRIVGMLALIALTAVIMVLAFPFFWKHPATRVALLFNAGLLAATVVFLFVVFRQDVFERWPFFKRLEERTKLGRIISRVYRAFRMCLGHRGLLTRTAALSLTNHVAFVAVAYFMGRALDIHLTFVDFLVVFPVINAVASIPLTPGGLGTREGTAIFLLGALNVPATSAITLSLLCYVSVLSWSLIGGIVYAAYLYSYGRAIRQELDHLEEEEDAEPKA